jgi:hypothetical protein
MLGKGKAAPRQHASPAAPPGAHNPARKFRIFLLSPANLSGKRARLLLNPDAEFDLAVRLRHGDANLGEVFAFVSGLYFRGKLAYAEAFAAPPPGLPESFVITAGRGLVSPNAVLTLEEIQEIAAIPIDAADPRYRLPLERDCRVLDELAGQGCEFVLLGSVATTRYSEPLARVFGPRLLFPAEFAGRGDMSRGGLMLRCVRAGRHLAHIPLGKVTHHGARPAKLPRAKLPPAELPPSDKP